MIEAHYGLELALTRGRELAVEHRRASRARRRMGVQFRRLVPTVATRPRSARRRRGAPVVLAVIAALALTLSALPSASAADGWQGPTSLGGEFTSGADLASSAPGRLEAFALGNDHKLWFRAFDPAAGWNDWQYIGAPWQGLTSDPTAVSWGPGRIDVFARAAGGTLAHIFTDDSGHTWSQWQDWGGNIVGGPDAASWDAGRLDVFARGAADSRLVHLTYDGTSWPPQWESLGGSVLTSDPSAISPSVGQIEVFARNTSDSMMRRSYSSARFGWDFWRPMPFGLFDSGPDAAFLTGGRMDVFALGRGGGMYQATYRDGAWSQWQPLGGVFNADPGAVSSGPGRLDVVGRGQDTGVWQFWNNG